MQSISFIMLKSHIWVMNNAGSQSILHNQAFDEHARKGSVWHPTVTNPAYWIWNVSWALFIYFFSQMSITLKASALTLWYCSAFSACTVEKIALAAEIAEEKLPHSECFIQSGGLFNGKMLATCNHIQRESILNHAAKMKMPAVA